MGNFQSFGLLESLNKSLKAQKITKPTEIQVSAIPLLMRGKSLVGVAETGSGKTLAYALPLLHKLKSLELDGKGVKEGKKPRALIMVPTRELGEQVSKVMKTLTHDTRLRVRPALGGMTFEHARRNIASEFEILLATPERLVQLLKGGYIDLSEVQTLIFDEADQMLDQGFLPTSDFIVKACPDNIQLSLFSATISNAVQELINVLFKDAEVIRTKNSGKAPGTLKTKNIAVKNGQRWPVLETLLKEKTEGGTLIFTNTRDQCDELTKLIQEKGFKCGFYRGEMSPIERKQTLKAFREGKIKTLVCTDLAARGLDIVSVERVINYHLPRLMDNYLHRAGRTARGGKPGLVVNLVTERDERVVAKIEGRKEVPLKDVFAKSKLVYKKDKQNSTLPKVRSAKTKRSK